MSCTLPNAELIRNYLYVNDRQSWYATTLALNSFLYLPQNVSAFVEKKKRNTVIHRGMQVIDFKPYIDSCVALHTCTCNVSSLPDLHYLHYCAFCGRGSCAIGASSLRSFIVSSLTSLSVCRLVTIRILSTPTHPCNYRTTKCSIQSKARTISPDRLIHPLTRLI